MLPNSNPSDATSGNDVLKEKEKKPEEEKPKKNSKEEETKKEDDAADFVKKLDDKFNLKLEEDDDNAEAAFKKIEEDEEEDEALAQAELKKIEEDADAFNKIEDNQFVAALNTNTSPFVSQHPVPDVTDLPSLLIYSERYINILAYLQNNTTDYPKYDEWFIIDSESKYTKFCEKLKNNITNLNDFVDIMTLENVTTLNQNKLLYKMGIIPSNIPRGTDDPPYKLSTVITYIATQLNTQKVTPEDVFQWVIYVLAIHGYLYGPNNRYKNGGHDNNYSNLQEVYNLLDPAAKSRAFYNSPSFNADQRVYIANGMIPPQPSAVPIQLKKKI
jgi:hypothetical protein